MSGQRLARTLGPTREQATRRVLRGSMQLYTVTSPLSISHLPAQKFTNACMSHWSHSNVAAAASRTGQFVGGSLQCRRLANAGRTATDTQPKSDSGKSGSNATELVKKLRASTAVSVGLCKQALEASNWNIEEALLYLRKAGIARAAKVALREAHEGVVAVCSANDGNSWNAVVLNCETDFVQRSSKFLSFSKALVELCASSPSVGGRPLDGSACAVSGLKQAQPSAELSALAQTGDGAESRTVEELLSVLTSQFGEKISISAVEHFDTSSSSCVGAYVHGEIEAGVGRVAALVEISYQMLKSSETKSVLCKSLTAFAKLLAMQVVAKKPKFITVDSIPNEFVEQERAVVEEAAAKQAAMASQPASKPASLTKAIEKRLKHCLEEQCLLQQEFLMMAQLHQDVLSGSGDEGSNKNTSENARPEHSSTVAEAMQLVGQQLGCSIEVTRMKLLAVGNR